MVHALFDQLPTIPDKLETKQFISVDTASFMVHGTTVNQVLCDVLKIDFIAGDSSVLLSAMEQLDLRNFTFNGIQFGFPKWDVLRQVNDDSLSDLVQLGKSFSFDRIKKSGLFDLNVPCLRVYISGTGMEYCREYSKFDTSLFKSFDDFLLHLTSHWYTENNFHFTRLDFAVDVFNDNVDFIGELTSLACCNPSVAFGFGRPIANRFVIGSDQRTVYLGSANSDKLMRIYDKFMQKQIGGFLPSDMTVPGIDVIDIENWTRFECQFRNRECDKWIPLRDEDPSIVLSPDRLLADIGDRYILHTIQISDEGKRFTRESNVLPFWDAYFSQFTQRPTTYTGNFVQLREVIPAACAWIEGTACVNLNIFVLENARCVEDAGLLFCRKLFSVLLPMDQGRRKQFLSTLRKLKCGGKDLTSYKDFLTEYHHKPAFLFRDRRRLLLPDMSIVDSFTGELLSGGDQNDTI